MKHSISGLVNASTQPLPWNGNSSITFIKTSCNYLIMLSIVLRLISLFRPIFIISGIRFPVSAYS